jgi:hypothetical protein
MWKRDHEPAWDAAVSIDPLQIPPLIRRFEPVLHFHAAERFFPCDAKRYMENAALWTLSGDSTQKTNWGGSGPGNFPRTPQLARGTIPAEPTSSTFDFTGGATNLFLDLRGWRSGLDVTLASDNSLSDLNGIAGQYGPAAGVAGFNIKLSNSRFWYHAEVLNAYVSLRKGVVSRGGS